MPFDQTVPRPDVLDDWCHELRAAGHKQSRDIWGVDGALCAGNVLVQHVSGGPAFFNALSPAQVTRVVELNRTHTFSEIADVLSRELARAA